jgi:uncharacterized protein YbjT (DUF2867 family)
VLLVVGATGQLGSLVVRELRREGRQVRALVRTGAPVGDLAATGAHLVVGDLRTVREVLGEKVALPA